MQEPVRYAVVGSGWRSEFFLRLAQVLPERFAVSAVVTRSAERGEQVAARWGVATARSLGELRDRPELVVTSVPWAVTPELVADAVERGLPVLAETPPAPDAAAMRQLWAQVGGRRLVQVAEQYLLLPGHAARRALVRGGVVGQVTSVQVSSTHLYHAVSMIRGLLGAGCGPVTVTASTLTAPLVDPLGRDGWRAGAEPVPAATTLAVLDFGPDGSGLYDFTDNQWLNPLRSRRLVVRGSTGELVDDTVVRLADSRSAVTSHLVRRQTGQDLNLEGFDLDHIAYDGAVVYRNPYRGARLSDEEIAIASLLDATGAWCRGEAEPPYPLAQGCQDHLLGLAIGQAAASGLPVRTAREPWAADAG